jgi:predicted PurR-regulated permease PerM
MPLLRSDADLFPEGWYNKKTTAELACRKGFYNAMNEKTKNYFYLIAFGVILFNVLWNLEKLLPILAGFLKMLSPLFAGGLIAFVLNVPMARIEKTLQGLFRKKKGEKGFGLIRPLSLFLTIVLVLGILIIFGTMIFPPLLSSVSGAASLIENSIPAWKRELDKAGIGSAQLNHILDTIRSTISTRISGDKVNQIVASVGSRFSATMNSLFNGLLSLIIALYFLMEKDNLYRQCRMFGYAFFPKKAVAAVGKVLRMMFSTYAQFLGGQCLEACILGFLMFVVFMVLRLPYAGLIAVMTGLFSFVPYIGSFLSCAVGALLIFMIRPMQALVFIIAYQLVQFTENQFIYPHVVGGSVGLPAFWTLLAVLFGGQTAGLAGMVFAIPTASVLYTLLGQAIHARLNRKADQ